MDTTAIPRFGLTPSSTPEVLSSACGFQPVDCMGMILVVDDTENTTVPSTMAVSPIEHIEQASDGMNMFGECLSKWKGLTGKEMPRPKMAVLWYWTNNDSPTTLPDTENVKQAIDLVRAMLMITGSEVHVVHIVGTTQGVFRHVQHGVPANHWHRWTVSGHWKSRHQIDSPEDSVEFWNLVHADLRGGEDA